MTQVLIARPQQAGKVTKFAAHLVDRVWSQVEDDYQRGRLDFETLNADYILRLEIDGVELEDIIDASNQPGLKPAVTLEAEKAISELRREAAADEREYRLKMAHPYNY